MSSPFFCKTFRSAAAALIMAYAALRASPAVAQMAPIWTGVYAGAQGGITWAELDIDQYRDFSTRDGVWGLHAGYNLANGRFVIGIEGDVNLAGAAYAYSVTGLGNVSAETDWSGSLRVRAGMTLGPAMVYGTVGYARAAADLRVTATALGTIFQSGEILTGIVYGAGAEGFVLPNISVRVEALQYDYSMQTDWLRPYFDPSETVVRAGLTYHLY